MFGELLGAWVAVVWGQLGRPDPFVLAEAGPGRGTLMADALRLLRRVAPACHAAARVHLIETSPRLRACQNAALKDATPNPAGWHAGLASLPEGPPVVLLANEFVDALPIRQFVRRGQGWAERFVQAGRFVEQAAALPSGHPALARPVPEGSVLETCQPALDFVHALAGRLQRARGAALLIDYGYDAPAWGDSLQALREGRPADPLCNPGTADLTAHVDFASMAQAAGGVDVWGSVKQGIFLQPSGWARAASSLRGRLPVRRGI